jgi:FixJ family two-component response regulator
MDRSVSQHMLRDPRRIAIVDDDAPLRVALARLVTALGFEARTYESGSSFIADAHTVPFERALLDQNMPGQSGLEVVELLRSIKLNIPAIIITCSDDPNIALECTKRNIPFLKKEHLTEALPGALDAYSGATS